jgi:hypothetical protein
MMEGDHMTAPATPLLDRLGPRALRRATPRLGPVLGGAGAALAFVGLLILAFDSSGVDEGEGDSNKMLGFLLCAAGVAAGYALIAAFRAGGLATFGSVVAVLLLPWALLFLTFDEGKLPPFSVDVVLMLSVVGWLLGYAFGPARGRPAFLGAAAAGLWLFILEQVDSVFSSPFDILPVAVAFDSSDSPSPDGGTIGLVCLIFAAAYLALAFLLDGRGLHGMATPLLAVGFVALFVGFVGIQEDLAPAGAGAVMIAAGLVVVWSAARLGRRGSAWIGGFAVVVGAAVIVVDAFEDADSPTAPALTLMLVGAAVALAGDRFAAATAEPSELALPIAEAPEPPTIDP